MELDLRLLLAHADDRRPVINASLPVNSITRGPRSRSPRAVRAFRAAFEDPNSLPAQRWGLVAPQGERGERLLSLIEPLRRLREEEQGGVPARVYRVPPEMSLLQATRWKEEVYLDEAVPEEQRPSYLLLLGDLDEVSLSLQQVLASDTFVGRLAFPEDEGFEAYVAKLLRWSRTPSREQGARALFYSARDGSTATSHGYVRLIRPSLERCRQSHQEGFFPAREIEDVADGVDGALEPLLVRAGASEASLLFTLSHGLGQPRAGWESEQTQRRYQGALCAGPGEHLVAESVTERPFLPGGMWLAYACFSAGTPSRSAYHHWLHQLQKAGEYREALAPVLAGLARRPFVAALPQAALANPEGPLAVIGHVDLAWTSSYQDPEGRSRPSRFTGLMRALANGCRAGVGLYALSRYATEMGVLLTHLLDLEEEARGAAVSVPPDPVHRAHLWMVRQDLSGFILLGDPAARLPLGSRPAKAALVAPSSTPLGPAMESRATGNARMEEAVLALLIGDSAAREIATRYGVSLGTLRSWEAVYREAGREALGRFSSNGSLPSRG